MPKPSPKLTLDQLAELREKTESISEFLRNRLRQHLTALYPVLAPKRSFGKYLGAKDAATKAEEAYSQLVQRFKEVSGAPFSMRDDLDESALLETENGIEIYPWEYSYQAGGKTIAMTNPFRWAVTYKSAYTLAQMRAMYIQGQVDKRPADVRHFLVNALALQVSLARATGAMQLLEDLRYEVKPDVPQGLGRLTILTVAAPLASFRPPDELILMGTRFSGVAAFIELVEKDAISLADPLRTQIESLLI